MKAAREMYVNKGTNNFVSRRSNKSDIAGKFNGHNTYHVDTRCDMGKKIDIHDIVAYIEKNKKFIDAPKNDTIGFMDDENFDKKMEPIHYNKSGPLDNLPNNLGSVFGSINNLKRLGVIHNVQVPAEMDISYVSSIFAVIDDEFTKMKESEQIDFTEIFIRRIHKESREKFIEYEYEKLGWDLKTFVNNIKTFTIGKDILRYIADYLFINIFIIDIESDSLVYVGEKRFIKFKKNVFILKLNNCWFESVLVPGISQEYCVPNTRYCEFNSSIIKKLINSRFLVERLDCDFTNEKEEFNFIVGQDNLERFLPKEEDIILNDVKPIESNTKDLSNESSDDLNGFDEHIISTDMKNISNNTGHLSDNSEESKESEDIEDIIDGDTIKKVIPKKTLLKSKKTHTKTTDDVTKLSKKISVKSNKTNIQKQPVAKYSDSDFVCKTVVQLKQLAKENNINITYDKSGKHAPKTRAMLLDDLSKVMI
jgi:hypothetical protein